MRKIKIFLFSLLLFVFLPCFSQDASQTEELMKTSSLIKVGLQNLKLDSMKLTNQLELVTQDLTRTSEDLKISEQKVKDLQVQSTELSNSLISINKELNNSYETITKYEQKLKTEKKIVFTLIIILLIMIVGKVVGYVLYAKGIKLPRWLDILL